MAERELHPQPDDCSRSYTNAGKHSVDPAGKQVPEPPEPVGSAARKEIRVPGQRLLAATDRPIQYPEFARGDLAKPDLWDASRSADASASRPTVRFWCSISFPAQLLSREFGKVFLGG